MTDAREALPEPFGYWRQGATEEESDFHLHSESGDVSCENCIVLYTASTLREEVRKAVAAALEAVLEILHDEDGNDETGIGFAIARVSAIASKDADHE